MKETDLTAKSGATSTTDDVLAGLDLKGKRGLVTGTLSRLAPWLRAGSRAVGAAR